MLFRNDEKYTLTFEDYKKMADFLSLDSKGTSFTNFPKGGVYIKYPQSALTANPDNPMRPDKPLMMIIPYDQDLQDDNEGTVKWNYCKRPPTIKPGESPVYYEGQDPALMMSHRISINENQPDLLFFLICISKRGSHVEGVSRAAYEIENKQKEATVNNNKRRIRIEVESAILHSATCMHIEDIVRIAKAMAVPNIDALSEDQIRDALLTKIEAMEKSDKKDGYKTFKEYTDTGSVGARVDLLVMIQKAKDMKLIKFFSMNNSWGTIDAAGKKTGKLCPIAPGRTPDDSLAYHVTTDNEIALQLKKLVEEAERELQAQEA